MERKDGTIWSCTAYITAIPQRLSFEPGYVLQVGSYVHDHAALPRMSANADFSTPLKYLASGKKSIEQLRPSALWQTAALELLVFYCFRTLLVYPCPLYYGMLILSRAHGAYSYPPAVLIVRIPQKGG